MIALDSRFRGNDEGTAPLHARHQVRLCTSTSRGRTLARLVANLLIRLSLLAPLGCLVIVPRPVKRYKLPPQRTGGTCLKSRKIIDFRRKFWYNGASFTVHDAIADPTKIVTLAGGVGSGQSVQNPPISHSHVGYSVQHSHKFPTFGSANPLRPTHRRAGDTRDWPVPADTCSQGRVDPWYTDHGGKMPGLIQ